MHEYSLMQRVIEAIQARLDEGKKEEKTRPVKEVKLTVGLLDIHSEAAFRQAFEVLAQGTSLEHAALTLEIVPATLTCPACGYHGDLSEGQADPHDPQPYLPCPKCGVVCAVQGGHGVETIELLLEDE
jgi:hydrogenase nickel insertion protein HypA